MRYVMLYEGATCEQNFFDLKGQFAYGIYGSDAEGYQLRPTNVAYWGNEGSSPLFIRARGQSERSKLVLLSSQPMTATKIKAKFYDETAGAIDFGLLTIADANTNLQTVAEPEGANRDNWQRATLYAIDRTTFQKQVLTTVARATSPDDDSVFVPPYRLHFAGDLDGDGKPDFIISGESAFSAEERLFLSTLAKKGEMVGEAARWNYCMEK